VIVAMGAVVGTIKEAVDKMKGVGVLRLTMLRPFPKDEIKNILKNKKQVIVLDRAISLGAGGILYSEIRNALCDTKVNVKSVIHGLGGRDVTVENCLDLDL